MKSFPAPGLELIIPPPSPVLPSFACALFAVSVVNAAAWEGGAGQGPCFPPLHVLGSKEVFQRGLSRRGASSCSCALSSSRWYTPFPPGLTGPSRQYIRGGSGTTLGQETEV